MHKLAWDTDSDKEEEGQERENKQTCRNGDTCKNITAMLLLWLKYNRSYLESY